jgi:hypothetical protein
MTTETIDIVFSFDTTGSMYPCLTQVRRSLSNTVNRLFTDIPNLRIGVIAHGDYCDAHNTYVTKILNLTADKGEIVSFINGVGQTGGGDAPECYELVLHQSRTKINWNAGNKKVLVVIGDDVPHGPNYPGNVDKIDWRNELGLLIESGVSVYGVHAMPGIRRHSKPFYEEIANKTGGFYLTLDQFSSIVDLIMGICYKQDSNTAFQAYVDNLQTTSRLDRSLRDSFTRMGATGATMPSAPRTTTVASAIPTGLVAVPSGRFQVMNVDGNAAIKEFVESQGITFNKGRGFYQLTKAEDVQQYKEIILQDPATGDFYNGSDARRILGLQPQTEKGGTTERLHTAMVNSYRVFVQSTSVNRKLIGGTKFLYEVVD